MQTVRIVRLDAVCAREVFAHLDDQQTIRVGASEVQFVDALKVGDEVTRTSTISDVQIKQGSTGTLCFVTVNHEITTPRGVAIRDRQDIVYRDVPPPSSAPAAAVKPTAPPPTAQHRETHLADPVLLFRYSALTFNGHRIHYDRRYVTEVEGYPGLIVHGPLIATLLMDLLRRHAPNAFVTHFEFKAVRPTFDLHPFKLNGQPSADGKTVRLWAQDHEGWLTMQATATLA